MIRAPAAAVAIVATLGGVLHADPPAPAKPPARRMYRGAIMLGDALSGLIVVATNAEIYREGDHAGEGLYDLAGVGLLYYAGLSAGGHHLAGHDGRAVASVVIRVALPITAAVIASDRGASGWRAADIAGGAMVAAMAIDWLVLADATYLEAPKPAPAPASTALYLAPVRGGGVIAGVTGAL